MRSPFNTKQRCVLGCVAAAILAGCAAIEIDVDVYKGPLAHEEEIQLRQFAATAIAAKPLLLSLRNDLEIAKRGTTLASFDAEVKREGESLDTFVGGNVVFQSGLAKFVNGATFYYEDMGNADELLKARAHLEDANRQLKAMSVNKADLKLAHKLQSVINESTAPEVIAKMNFAMGYLTFVCGAEPCASEQKNPYRNVGALQAKCKAMQELEKGLVCPDESGANEGFSFLMQERNAAAHSMALFGEVDPAFVQRVVEVSRAFIDMRGAMHGVFVSLLNALEQSPDNSAQQLYVSWLVPQAMQALMLACYTSHAASVHAPQVATLTAEFRESLRGPLAHPSGIFLPIKSKPLTWDKLQYDAAAKAIELTAQRYPKELVRFLRATDATLPQLDRPRTQVSVSPLEGCAAVAEKDFEHISRPQSLAYGLARSAMDPALLQAWDEYKEKMLLTLTSATAKTASGFDRARLPGGIESLTREFEQALDETKHRLDDPKVQDAKNRLEETLIFFAERLLFVANNITPSSLENDLPRGGDGGAGDHQAAIKNIAARVAVLETLGNTLVLHANDLRRRQRHQAGLKNGYQSEQSAAAGAYSPGAASSYDAVLAQVRTELKSSSLTVKKATPALAAASSASASLEADLVAARTATAIAGRKQGQRRSDLASLESFVRTTVALKSRQALYPANDKTKEEEDDAGGLAAYVKQELDAATATTSLRYLGVVSMWMELQTSGPGSDTPRLKRMTAARDFLSKQHEGLEAAVSRVSKPDAVAAGVRELVLRWARDAVAELASLEIDTKDTAAKEKAIKTRLEAAQARQTSVGKPLAKAESDKTLFDAVIPILEEQRDAVVREAEKVGAVDPRSTLVLLRQSLAARKAKPGEPKASELDATLKYLAGINPPNWAAAHPGADRATRVDVLDHVITTLQHQRIGALASGRSGEAKNLTTALNVAYEARAGSAYLRPSSDYLKNVYSATTLQEGTPAANRNMLSEWRQNLGGLFSPNEFNKAAGEAKEKVEKLYWQNINRVSLNGGGSSNYVIAKDDVGNWYVKAYSSDPSTIIKSAQGLALFNMGGRLNTNLLRRVEMQRSFDDKGTTAPDKIRLGKELSNTSPESNAALLKVRDRYQARYAAAADAASESILQTIQALPEDIRVAASKESSLKELDADALGKRLLAAQSTELDAAAKGLTSARALTVDDTARLAKLEAAVSNAVGAMRRFRQVAYADLASNESISTNPLLRAAAASFTQRKVMEKMTSSIAPYRTALTTYEGALINIGDVAASGE